MSLDSPIIEIHDLSYRPLGAASNVLKNINLELRASDFALLLGPSGCGKSVLTHCLNGLIPHLEQGEMSGCVRVADKDTAAHEVYEFASTVGMVFQNPDDQILSLRVAGEVAFGLENQGLGHTEIVRRVEEFLQLLEIAHLRDRLTFAISGGQKQRVSIASNLAMLQQVLVLDDPTTDLDPMGKADIVRLLARLHGEMGKTLLIIEHDLNELVELANRVVVMESGQIVHDGPPARIFSDHYDELVGLGVNIPQHVEIAHTLLQYEKADLNLPICKAQALELLRSFHSRHPGLLSRRPRPRPAAGKSVISVRDLTFSYSPSAPILRGLDFDICEGEFVAIIGANGSGKSTLVNTLIGLLRPDQGSIQVNGRDTRATRISDLVADIGYVFQNPDHQLFESTVEDELYFSLRTRKLDAAEAERRVQDTLSIVGLTELRSRHPFSLSRGQRQNLAVATALIHHPKLILLDEPTTGQDRKNLTGLLAMLSGLNAQGNTTVMVTHDMDLVAAYATRVIVMADGKIVLDGPPENLFYDHFDLLSQLNLRPPTLVDFCHQMEKQGCPRFLIVDELAECLGRR